MTILEFFFDSARHYIQLLILLVLICPWHWTTSRRHRHIIEFDIPKKKEEQDERIKLHSDKPKAS